MFKTLCYGLSPHCKTKYVHQRDRDRNEVPNYKQTESSQTHCTNQWFFPDKYCPVFDKIIGKILNFKNLFAHVNSTNFCSVFGRNRQIWLTCFGQKKEFSFPVFFPLYYIISSFVLIPSFVEIGILVLNFMDFTYIALLGSIPKAHSHLVWRILVLSPVTPSSSFRT
jgi:hypothetical protein